MKCYDILEKIKNETGIEFKVYNAMNEKRNSATFPYEIVVCGDDIEHLTILKNADVIERYFDYFLNIKSLTFFCASSKFDVNSLCRFRCITSLNISGNGLRELPSFIGEMKSLTSLDISGNDLTELPSFIGGLKNLTSLDISGNDLTELPSFIRELKNLTSLDISGNDLTELPSFIRELKNLTSLNISHNSLTELPSFIGELNNLTSLDISRNGLTELPSFIGELKNLKSLYAGNNHLIELPSFIGELKNLTSLYLWDNNLTELPPFIGELKNLTKLNIGGNNLTKLPSFIGELKNLTLLFLWSNNLTELPAFIGELKNLTEFNIGGNSLIELPPFIGELKNLTLLYLWDSNITGLPSFIRELKNLTSLNLRNNNLVELPFFIGELKNLTSLNIGNNNLTELPSFIGELKNLTSLGIGGNRLTELPSFLGKLTNILKLDISSLTLNHIPKEIIDLDIPFSENYSLPASISMSGTKLKKMDKSLFEQPYDIIKQFYEADLIELKECKLILLGDGQSGKTCLVERLIEGTYPKKSPPTDGIIIKDWITCFSNGDNVKIKVLDFGGQEVMHSMHTCFLTSRTVYLVVLDGRQDMLNDLLARNWMENIKTFAPDSPVIIVISKVDADGNPNASLNGNDLKKDYQNLLFVEKVSAKKGSNIELLKERIEYAIECSSGYKYCFNANWMKIKDEIEGMKNDYIKDTVYDEICERYELTDDYFKDSLLEWFKDLGVSYYYKSDEFSPANEKYRVLNPAWLTNGIYTLILKTPSNTGLLSHNIIKATLHKNKINKTSVGYTDEEINFILYVMRQHEISLNVENNTEFIPSKLDKEKPEFIFDKETSLHISWAAKYIPNIVLHRLMVRNYKKIDVNCMWRTGAVFSDCATEGDCKYKVLVEKNDTQMDLYVYSKVEEPRIHLQAFRESINEALKKIGDAEESIHYNINGEQGKEFYDDVLTQFLQAPNREIFLRDIKGYALPQEILKQVFTDDFIRYSEREEKMNNNFSGANINSVNIVENGSINLQYAAYIKNISSISDEKLLQLFESLKEIVKNERIEKPVKEELTEVIGKMESSEKSTWRQHIQNFFGNASNLATLASLGLQITDYIK